MGGRHNLHGRRSVRLRSYLTPVLAAAFVLAALVAAIELTASTAAHAQTAVPSIPTGLAVSTSTHDSVTLTWNDPEDSSVTGYQVLRRTRDGSVYGDGLGAPEFVAIVADTGSATTTYTDTSVTPHTRYVYRVKAMNATGLSERSNYANAETGEDISVGPAPPPREEESATSTHPILTATSSTSSVPSIPTGLAVSTSTHDSVTLTWNDPEDSSVTGYQVLRRPRDGSVYGDGLGAPEFVAIVADTGSATTTYTDTSVTPHTRYVYRVKARNATGLSERSNYANAETGEDISVGPAPPPREEESATSTHPILTATSSTSSVPSIPTGLAASTSTHDSVALTWNDPGDSSVTGYQVLRRPRDGSVYGDGQGAPEFVVIVADTGSATTTYTDTSVTPHTRYVYRVKARNATGLSERSNYANAETGEEDTATSTHPILTATSSTSSVPSIPTGLAVSTSTHDSVTLTWDDPNDSSITGYAVRRRVGSSGEFTTIVDNTATTTTSHTDDTVTASTTYEYRVVAVNDSGTSSESAILSVTTGHSPEVPERTCAGDGGPPTATNVPVTAVPVVATSTTADYFVLYASHDIASTTVEYPVQVTLGNNGTTTLAENVAALPMERYRVERYLVADPADVDGDCTDDITELDNLGTMNPVNPTITIELSQGAVSIPDRQTFETLSYEGRAVLSDTHLTNLEYVKFTIALMDTDRPVVYFQNTNTNRMHPPFLRSIGIFDHPQYDRLNLLYGEIVYHPNVIAPDGSLGVYRFQHQTEDAHEFEEVAYAYGLLAASMPLLDNNLAYYPVPEFGLLHYHRDRVHYDESRINVLLQEDIFPDVDFIPHNVGERYGFLRVMSLEERPNPRDIVIYESLPNDLPRVAGIISTVPQTPLSHVNLRAVQDGAPNAFIRGALEDSDIEGLIDSHVYYEVTSSGYSIRAATQAGVEEHYAALRPVESQTPQRDLSVTSITSLSEIGFDDWDSFGVKAANVAVLGTLGFPKGTVPDGFAIPFYFYDEFMKHNELYDDIEEMLADPDFQTDYDIKEDELKKLRKKIKKAETPEWIDTALTTMHATFAKGASLRYRSSTNNEDLPNFSGAGLYDSKTQHPEETEEDGISKSLKQVYASLWNFRAFIERDFHRIDHMAAAMGVLVHPNFSDELVNGVAVSVDPVYGTDGAHYVNSQAGEDLVTNPEANSVPEAVLLHSDGTYTAFAFSNQVPRGQMLMTSDQLGQLRQRLDAIHEKFEDLYDVEEGEQFAMEIEFKITSDNVLSIKQARPWIFASSPLAVHSGVALTGSFEGERATHDGDPFRVVVKFSDIVDIADAEFRDHAVSVTGARVERVARVTGRANEWLIRVAPDSPITEVTLTLTHGVPCTIPGAICTRDGRQLSNRLEHTVEGLRPDRPTWESALVGRRRAGLEQRTLRRLL